MNCRICDSQHIESAIDLGRQPWANHFIRPEQAGQEPFYPLHVVFCHDCRCAQLDYTVPKEVMFTDHTYVSGTTATLRQHFRTTAERMDAAFFKSASGKSMLDIGSNDGSQLYEYQQLGYDVLGVESCERLAQMANASGLPTVAAFFNLETARRLNRKFHIINASGVFFHLEELHPATEAVRECLRADGVFVVQFLYMKNIVENLAFDQIYHEHLLYYTLRSIRALLSRHNLEAFDGYWEPIHGGSIILMVGHRGQRPIASRLQALCRQEDDSGINELATYREFARRIAELKQKTLDDLGCRRSHGKRIYGMGAPIKGNTLLNTFGIGTAYLEMLVERNPLRKGLVSPGMHIPIVMEDEIPRAPDVYFVLAWNFKREILERYARLIRDGVEFYFPINLKSNL